MSSDSILTFSDSVQHNAVASTVAEARWATYVTFRLGAELFGFPVGAVQEVVRVGEVVRVPHAPYAVRGVCNLRGRVIPVVDLRVRLGLTAAEFTPQSRILVTPAHSRLLGLLVDSVAQVERVDELRIEAPPADVRTEHSEYITGVYQQDPLFLILLDAERVLLLPEGLQERNNQNISGT